MKSLVGLLVMASAAVISGQMFSDNMALPLALMGGNGGGNNFLNAMLMGPMMSSDAGPAMMMAMQSQNQKHSATNVQPAAAQKTQSQGFSPMLLALASGSSDTMKRLAPFLMMQQNMV